MTSATGHRYLIALGSNIRHHRHGPPRDVLRAALAALEDEGVDVLATAPPISSAPLGPSRRRYANGAALVETALEPEELLTVMKRIERDFGRQPGGQRWGSRVLDLDIVLWDGGPYVGGGLTIPHPRFRERHFVLEPAVAIVPRWRDPITGRTLRQLSARLTAPRPLPR
jgi:2-amino-4-hydroxy-6-hydroxymethyldihydropteridine diphosphokinase